MYSIQERFRFVQLPVWISGAAVFFLTLVVPSNINAVDVSTFQVNIAGFATVSSREKKMNFSRFFKQILFSTLSRYISTILSQQLRSTAIFHHCQCFAASVPRIWFGLAFANLDMLDVLAPYGRYSDVWAPKQVFWESQKASKRSNVWGIGAPSEGEVIAEHQEVISEEHFINLGRK